MLLSVFVSLLCPSLFLLFPPTARYTPVCGLHGSVDAVCLLHLQVGQNFPSAVVAALALFFRHLSFARLFLCFWKDCYVLFPSVYLFSAATKLLFRSLSFNNFLSSVFTCFCCSWFAPSFFFDD